jgi:hypothetical protein
MSYGDVPTVIRPSSHAWALNEEQSQPFFKQAWIWASTSGTRGAYVAFALR